MGLAVVNVITPAKFIGNRLRGSILWAVAALRQVLAGPMPCHWKNGRGAGTWLWYFALAFVCLDFLSFLSFSTI